MEQLRIHDIIDHMIRTEHKHRAVCDKALSTLGLHRSQLRMLMFVWHHGGEMSQHDMAEKMHITAAVVTVTAQKLESEGYITRAQSTKDKRHMVISLTDRGRDMVDRAHGTLDAVDTVMLQDFSEEEKYQLIDFYERMLANLCGREGEKNETEMV